jgi:hypothetical protein
MEIAVKKRVISEVKIALTSFKKIKTGNGSFSRKMEKERAVCRFFEKCRRDGGENEERIFGPWAPPQYF